MINSINIKIYIKGDVLNITWKEIEKFDDIKYERGINSADGINKITINRTLRQNNKK